MLSKERPPFLCSDFSYVKKKIEHSSVGGDMFLKELSCLFHLHIKTGRARSGWRQYQKQSFLNVCSNLLTSLKHRFQH